MIPPGSMTSIPEGIDAPDGQVCKRLRACRSFRCSHTRRERLTERRKNIYFIYFEKAIDKMKII